MPTRARRLASIVTLALLAPATAVAHPDHDAGNLLAGMLHPLTGVDHVLMIVAISAWAALLPAWSRVAVAACMALCVGIGALLPSAGGPALEGVIALTLIGAGILLATGRRLPLWAAGSVAALFSLVHGVAHGAQGPDSGLYVAGLVAAAAALVLSISFAVAHLQVRRAWWKVMGAASAGVGALALVI